MLKISNWLKRVSTGWVTLLGLVIFIAFMVLVLPGQATNTASDEKTPDLSFMYSVTELYEMAESYGEQGRVDYVKARFTFDLVWPIVYTFFLVTAISWLFGKTTSAASIWQRANLFPILAMALDYLENISTSIVMVRFPVQTPIIDMLATVFTPLKWIFVGASFVLLLIGLVLFTLSLRHRPHS